VDEEERKEFFITRSLQALGVATLKEIVRYFGLNRWCHYIPDLKGQKGIDYLEKMAQEGMISEVKIEELPNRYWAISKEARGLSSSEKRPPKERVCLLSPFDNAIAQRERTRTFFGLTVKLEAYVAPAKREYGYFCMPILYGDRLVGRLDPKALRDKNILEIRSIYLEDPTIQFDQFLPLLADELISFAQFNHCSKVRVLRSIPNKYLRPLRRQLASRAK
jgi:uncharacterized protein YcaQ